MATEATYPKGTVVSASRTVKQYAGEDAPRIKLLAHCDLAGMTETQVRMLAFNSAWIQKQRVVRSNWSDYAKLKEITFDAIEFVRLPSREAQLKVELASCKSKAEKLNVLAEYFDL